MMFTVIECFRVTGLIRVCHLPTNSSESCLAKVNAATSKVAAKVIGFIGVDSIVEWTAMSEL